MAVAMIYPEATRGRGNVDPVHHVAAKDEKPSSFYRIVQYARTVLKWAPEMAKGLRAKRRLGELSRELETAPGEGGHNRKALPNAGKSVKRAVLKAAKVSTSEAPSKRLLTSNLLLTSNPLLERSRTRYTGAVERARAPRWSGSPARAGAL